MRVEFAAEFQHGERSRYVKGCRCEECRAANTAYARERARLAREAPVEMERPADGICPGVRDACGRKLYEDRAVCARCQAQLVWNGLVDAKRARKHLQKLSRKGVGRRRVSEACDVSPTILFAIRTGKKRTIRQETEDRILSVTAEVVTDATLVPSEKTRAMLWDLEVEWMTKGALALALGYQTPALQIAKGPFVLARTEQRVARFYRQAMGREFSMHGRRPGA